MKFLLSLTILGTSLQVLGQHTETSQDSIQWLAPVMVKAFEQQGALLRVPASMIVLDAKQLSQYGGTSVLQAVNAQPGVKLEERSPGSYRMNIRASSLRAPFGVRNVKMYWNELPYTTPGGDSYFNQLGYFNMQSIEILKGPGSSLYGAGTGGVLLIQGMSSDHPSAFRADCTGGSFGTRGMHLQAYSEKDSVTHQIQYQRFQTDGYRIHTAMRRDVFNWDTKFTVGSHSMVQTHFLLGDLRYETPGALTRAAFDLDPRQARPRVGSIPGAIEAKASIRQMTYVAGMTMRTFYSAHWQHRIGVYAAYTDLHNPGIFNYSRTIEPHVGGRSVWQYTKGHVTMHFGAEYQKGFSQYRSFKNVNGRLDSLRTDDAVRNEQGFVFAQASFQTARDWTFTGGASFHSLNTAIDRLHVLPVTTYHTDIPARVSPRLSIQKIWHQQHALYAVVSEGFSPPTLSEFLPSSGILAASLMPEQAWNVELGGRGDLFAKRILYDINMFWFQLNNAIVIRRDDLGRDYFVNAGATKQQGIEAAVRAWVVPHIREEALSLQWLASYTYASFHYKHFQKGTTDYSGKQLPGIPSHQWMSGIDARWLRCYLYFRYQYVSTTPLNDANTDRAPAFGLMDLKLGKTWSFKNSLMDVYVSGQNLLNTHYSLGFDLNATGGRYWNAASGRNFQIGISIRR